MRDRSPLHGVARALVLSLALTACRHDRTSTSSQPAAQDSAVPEPAPAPAPPSTLPALASTPAIVPLPIPDFPEAVVSVPLGALGPRPVVVATHGLWDFPEGLCDNWRWILGDRAWVLCPRGDVMPDKTFRYRSGPALAKEIDAGVRALATRYPGYVDEGPRVYTGFSLGAILGVWIIAHDPGHYPRAVLIEGGEDRVTDALAAAYAHGGGERVLFACGLRGRVDAATRAAHRFEHAGVGSRVVLGKLPDAGQFIHWYNGPVAAETKAQWPWLVEGDPRWVE